MSNSIIILFFSITILSFTSLEASDDKIEDMSGFADDHVGLYYEFYGASSQILNAYVEYGIGLGDNLLFDLPTKLNIKSGVGTSFLLFSFVSTSSVGGATISIGNEKKLEFGLLYTYSVIFTEDSPDRMSIISPTIGYRNEEGGVLFAFGINPFSYVIQQNRFGMSAYLTIGFAFDV